MLVGIVPSDEKNYTFHNHKIYQRGSLYELVVFKINLDGMVLTENKTVLE